MAPLRRIEDPPSCGVLLLQRIEIDRSRNLRIRAQYVCAGLDKRRSCSSRPAAVAEQPREPLSGASIPPNPSPAATVRWTDAVCVSTTRQIDYASVTEQQTSTPYGASLRSTRPPFASSSGSYGRK